ncbi:hypothetical protein BDV12DRAFT_201325 [Aspergillus spectabilis]
MTDVGFDNFLNDQPLSYHDEGNPCGLNQWSGGAFLEPPAATRTGPIFASGLDDIEHIYTVLHKGVDQVVAELSARMPPRLDQIREQNRKLIDKLTTLDNAITDDPSDLVLASSPYLDPSQSAPEMERTRRACKKRRVSQSTSSGGNPDLQPHSQSHGHRTLSSSGGIMTDSKLASKLAQIGSQETRAQVAEFASQLKTPECQNAFPDSCQFSSMYRVTDVSQFVRVVLDLGLAIESSSFGEQNSRIRKRIALAHFYNAYTMAQNNPDMFLSWCENQQVHGGSMPPRGGNRSVVQHRFADLIFSQNGDHLAIPSAHTIDSAENTKRRIAKIQMWRKTGKKWAQIIQRFGYGILLLLPASLSDEDLRIAQDGDLACCLEQIDSRKHLFADVLQQANDLLSTHFFPQEKNPQLSNKPSGSRPGSADWNGLLNDFTRGSQSNDDGSGLERLDHLDMAEFEQLYQTGRPF